MSVDSKMTAIADAIRGKTGGTEPLNLDQMAEEIAGITTGVDVSDSTVTPEDMVQGVTAYDKTGEMIEGSMEVAEGLALSDVKAGIDGEYILVQGKTEILNGSTFEKAVVTPKTEVVAYVTPSEDVFGNASPSDVANGKTFTSAEGTRMEGTLFEESILQLHESVEIETDDGTIEMVAPVQNDAVVRKGAYTRLIARASEFGDAAPEEVVKGKTFTSSRGVKVEGTMEPGAQLPNLSNPGTDEDLASGKQMIDQDGNVVEGNIVERTPEADDLYKSVDHTDWVEEYDPEEDNQCLHSVITFSEDALVRKGTTVNSYVWGAELGDAKPEHVAKGQTFTSASGLKIEGTALIPGGGFVYPDGAFAPVKSFTAGKQYALVAMIGGVRRFINTTDYNQYTMNATTINIGEDAGDYVIFSETPALFTAVASGDGFLLQNGNNYLHGTSSGGTALRFGTTQMVWNVDDSETGGFSAGKYNAKEDPNAVWLMNVSGGYNWSIKFETAGSFGYDREGRDNTYSTGFTPFVLYEYVAGEGEISPVVDTSDADAKASDMAVGKVAYVKGRRVEGSLENGLTTYRQHLGEVDVRYEDGAICFSRTYEKDAIYRKGDILEFWANDLGNAAPEDVAKGKTFTTGTGLKQTGIHECAATAGSVIKTGTTTARTIDTGLSEIEEFFIYKESVTATGLIHLHYSKSGGTSYLHASAWSTQNYGTKTIANGTTAATVSGGSITIPGTSATTGGLSSGVTYKWIAIGKE